MQKTLQKNDDATIARRFNTCVLQGNIGALDCLSHSITGGVLSFTNSVSSLAVVRTVRDILLNKHLSGQLADPSLTDTSSPMNPIIFQNLTHETIQRAAFQTQDAAPGLSVALMLLHGEVCVHLLGLLLGPCVLHWLQWVDTYVLLMYISWLQVPL